MGIPKNLAFNDPNPCLPSGQAGVTLLPARPGRQKRRVQGVFRDARMRMKVRQGLISKGLNLNSSR